jgi:hypothetical protein|tara:strand:+ start:98 stop:334 length:237 start_codon:yes stop_codon:yes gene_type:complete
MNETNILSVAIIIFLVGIITLMLIPSSIIDENPNGKCYDSRDNEINDLTCKEIKTSFHPSWILIIASCILIFFWGFYS